MYYFIINPTSRSGRGKKYWKRVKPILEEKHIEYQAVFSKKPGHTQELIKQLCDHHQDEKLHLVILGGDGTVNEALQGIRDFEQVTISYIPTGSSNDLARDLGISRVPEEAMNAILEVKNDIYMDMGLLHYDKAWLKGRTVKVSDRRFAVGGSIGFDAAVCVEANSSPVKGILNRLGLGKLTYLGIALKQLILSKQIDGRLILDDGEPIFIKNILFIVSMVHRYEGGGFMFCPNASYTDGLLDVCTAADGSLLRILRILPTAFQGHHISFKEIGQYRAKKVVIETQEPLWVQTDGEAKAQATRIQLTCMDEKLHFIY